MSFLSEVLLFLIWYKYVNETKEKTSQYKGVHWNRNRKKWYAVLWSKEGKQKYGGSLSKDLDAAKSVNQLCKELGIPEKNPRIGKILHRQWKVTQQLLH